MSYLDSKYTVVQDVDLPGRFALLKIPTLDTVVSLTRDDLLKIMRDCSMWLDEVDPTASVPDKEGEG